MLGFNGSILGFNDLISGFDDSILGFMRDKMLPETPNFAIVQVHFVNSSWVCNFVLITFSTSMGSG